MANHLNVVVHVREIFFFFFIHGIKFCAPFTYNFATFFMALCDLSSDVLFMSAQPCQDFVAFCYYYSSADCSQIFCICVSAQITLSVCR